MNETNGRAAGPIRWKRNGWPLVGLWTAAIGAALAWELVDELTPAQSGLRAHLTSMDPVRSGNAPDAWERDALKALKDGESEVSSVVTIDGEPYLRLMRPLQRGEMIRRTVVYGSVWLLGLGGILVGSRHLRRQIEHRRQAEQALGESQARIRETAASIPGVVYQFVLHADRSYAFPYVSEGIGQILGITPEQVQRDPEALLPGVLYQEELEPVFQSIYESAEKMSTWQRELQCQSTGGEIKWIRAISSPHALPDGGVLWNGVFLDITQLKKAERQLQEANDLLEQRVAERTAELEEANRELHKEIADRKRAERWLLESEERFRSYFELSLVGMAIVSPEKDWVEVNHRLCRMLGYSQQELVQKTWDELTHPEDRPAEQLQFDRMLSGMIKGYSMDKRFLHKDGQTVDASLTVRCLRRCDGTVDCLVALVQDITRRKRAEEETRKAQQQVLELQRREKQRVEHELEKVRDRLVRQTRLATIGQVSACIAHELRNPLGAVRDAACRLNRKGPAAEVQWRECLEIIERETAAAGQIISDLVAMSQCREPSRKPVPLETIVTQARSRLAAPRRIQWQHTYQPDPFVIDVDAAQWEQVLRNLFTNSLQVLGEAGTIRVEATRSNEHDQVLVSDDGPGVLEEHRPYLFEPLFTTRSKGTGLGLTICRQIIQRHAGTIELLESDRGAAFRIRLPRNNQGESAAKAEG